MREELRLLEAVDAVVDGVSGLDEIARRIAELLVPGVAELCMIDLLGEGDMLRRVATAAHPPGHPVQAWMHGRRPSSADRGPGVRRTLRSAQTIVLQPIDEPYLARVAHDEADLAQAREFGPRALVIVPLRSRARVLGAISFGVLADDRRFDPEDVRFAEVLAGRVALALDNAGLSAELEAAERQLLEALDGLPDAVVIHDAEGRPTYVNHVAGELPGMPPAGVPLGVDAAMGLLHEDGSDVQAQELPGRRVFETGREEELIARRQPGPDGDGAWLRIKATPLHDADGRVIRAVNVIEDLTLVKRAEEVQRSIARTLQHALLPPRLPVIPGFDVAALYRPALSVEQVGGDFYDIVPLPAGRHLLVIGDVTGKGTRAAALTARARHTLITAVAMSGDPCTAYEHLDRVLTDEGPEAFVTAAMLLVEPDGRTFIAVAGHPLPLLARGGEVRPVGCFAPLLGGGTGGPWAGVDLALEPGDALVLYTDGVVDAVGAGGERFRDQRLREALTAAGPDARAAALIEALEHALAGFQQGAQRDDVAAVVLRRVPVSR